MSAYEYGFLLAAAGIGLGFWRQKRKFDRTNSSGVEQFRSFWRKMLSTMFDDLLSWVSIASLFIGLFIMAFS